MPPTAARSCGISRPGRGSRGADHLSRRRQAICHRAGRHGIERIARRARPWRDRDRRPNPEEARADLRPRRQGGAATATTAVRAETGERSGLQARPTLAKTGDTLFGANCAVCHGWSAAAGGYGPDLRGSGVPLSAEAFEASFAAERWKRTACPSSTSCPTRTGGDPPIYPQPGGRPQGREALAIPVLRESAALRAARSCARPRRSGRRRRGACPCRGLRPADAEGRCAG